MRFESFWIQVYPLVPILRSLTVFSLFSPFLNFKEVFQRLFWLWLVIAECFFTDGFIPFYSIFLGFLVYHWFPPFAALGTRTNVVSATLVASPFLIFSLYFSFEISPKKFPIDIPFLRGVLRANFQSSLPKAFRCSFSDLPFGCFSFVIFSEWVDFFLLSWKILSHLPSWFTFLRSPTYQASFYQVLIPK